MITSRNKLIEESVQDLHGDFDELLYLITSQKQRLDQFIKDINKVKAELRPELVKNVLDTTSKLIVDSEQYVKQIQKYVAVCLSNISIQQLDQLYTEKLTLFELIRVHFSQTAAIITSIDWQSPSFLHSHFSMAGKQTGRIVGTMNDYKRDHHLDALAFENKFKQEYIDGFLKLHMQAFATSSGMAAFTTILTFLQMKQKITEPILIGKSIYFENKTLVKNIFKDQVVEVDEENTTGVCNTITRVQPAVIIFDSLSNTNTIIFPNLPEIIKFLLKETHRDTYLVIDNTCLSVSSQILKQTFGKNPNIHTIVFESLNKYYQFGMDRVTGGIFWTTVKDGFDLFKTREYCGTNITDASSFVLPSPNRKLLAKRLERFERNSQFLTQNLQENIDKSPNKIIDHIVYPGLSNHQSFSWNKHVPFHGSFFSIAFKPQYQKISFYKKFVEQVIFEGKRQNVEVVSGTSFGFNTTRIYLTALHSEFGDPFVRVAVGTEPKLYIEKIKDVFIHVFDRI